MDLFNLPFFRSYEAALGWLISRVKNVETSEANAKASEEAAAASATRAENFAEDANGSKAQAAIFANQASGYADAAAGSAESIEGLADQIQLNTDRIDNLVANAGDTDNNAELLDIRVSYDGVTYPTAGDAVRAQAMKLWHQAPNMYNEQTAVSGYISDVNGTISADADYTTSDFIPVRKGEQVTISPRARKLLEYYPNKYPVVTSYQDISSAVPFKYTPTMDGYIRISFLAVDPYKMVSTYEMLNTSAMIQGYLSDSAGKISSSPSYLTTDFMRVSEGVPVVIYPRARKILEYNEEQTGIGSTFIDTTSQDEYVYTPSGNGYIRVTMFTTDNGKTIHPYGESGSYSVYGQQLKPNTESTYNELSLSNVQAYINSLVRVNGQNGLNILTADGTVQNTVAVVRTPMKANTDYYFSFKVKAVHGTHAVVWTRLINSSNGLYGGFLISKPEAGKTYFGKLTTNADVVGLHIMVTNIAAAVEVELSDMCLYKADELTKAPVEPLEHGFTDPIARAWNGYKLEHYPLTAMPDYVLNTLAYKPLGSLEKAYICLCDDDGAITANTYAIPMVINKNVPCTFGMASNAEALNEDASIMVDAVNNHGCELAQHGDPVWTDMSEEELRQYFETEKVNFAALGLDPKSAIVPSHYINKTVKAVAGGTYGVVRCGYDGHVESCENFYDYYCNGPRNNQYALTAFNPKGHTLEWMQEAIEYCIANNYLCVIYFHDWDIGEGTQEKLESIIDYAKGRNVEFITLSQVEQLA